MQVAVLHKLTLTVSSLCCWEARMLMHRSDSLFPPLLLSVLQADQTLMIQPYRQRWLRRRSRTEQGRTAGTEGLRAISTALLCSSRCPVSGTARAEQTEAWSDNPALSLYQPYTLKMCVRKSKSVLHLFTSNNITTTNNNSKWKSNKLIEMVRSTRNSCLW